MRFFSANYQLFTNKMCSFSVKLQIFAFMLYFSARTVSGGQFASCWIPQYGYLDFHENYLNHKLGRADLKNLPGTLGNIKVDLIKTAQNMYYHGMNFHDRRRFEMGYDCEDRHLLVFD